MLWSFMAQDKLRAVDDLAPEHPHMYCEEKSKNIKIPSDN